MIKSEKFISKPYYYIFKNQKTRPITIVSFQCFRQFDEIVHAFLRYVYYTFRFAQFQPKRCIRCASLCETKNACCHQWEFSFSLKFHILAVIGKWLSGPQKLDNIA